MKRPNHHTFVILTVLGVLLAAMSTGSLSLCDLFGSEPEIGVGLSATVEQGSSAVNFTPLSSIFARFALCNLEVTRENASQIPAGVMTIVPDGVYCRTNRDLRGEANATLDLITSANTPVGHYLLEYRIASGGTLTIGTLDLTVLEGTHNPVTACMAVFGEGEIILVNQTVNYYACCSSGPEGDPVVQYKWWFDYNGNPSSPPSVTVTSCETTHTYSTPGPRTVRLLVRTQSGLEASDTQDIMVNGR